MGIVVFRSTTPWVAESSRSNSDLLTVISIVAVPAADAIASTGISPKPLWRLLGLLSYIKTKTYKTSSNSREVGKVEIRAKFNLTCTCGFHPRVQDQARSPRARLQIWTPTLSSTRFSHTFHSRCTIPCSEDLVAIRKSCLKPLFIRPIARSACSAACLNLCRFSAHPRSSRRSAAPSYDAYRQTAARSPAATPRSDALPDTWQSAADKRSPVRCSSP